MGKVSILFEVVSQKQNIGLQLNLEENTKIYLFHQEFIILLGIGEARMEFAADLFWEDKEGTPLMVRRSVETRGDRRLGELVSRMSP